LINGLLIVGASGFILYDAIQKFQNPVEIPGNTMMLVAAIGIVVNTGTALLFVKGRNQDLNIKGAFLHMTADAAVTLGVLIGGIIMKYTGAYWVDPLLSVIIVGVILYSAIGLLIESAKLVMDAVPKDIDLESVRTYLLEKDPIQDVHDLHIWPLSTTEVTLTTHLVIPDGCTDNDLFELRQALHDQFGIDHSTLQVEHTFEDEAYRNC
jgi:cobalt-zinc-cadmium efflux system protein